MSTGINGGDVLVIIHIQMSEEDSNVREIKEEHASACVFCSRVLFLSSV